MRRQTCAATGVIIGLFCVSCASRGDVQLPDPSVPPDARAAPSASEPPSHPKSIVVPTIEIVAMDGMLNLIGRRWVDRASFDVTAASIRRNLRRAWVIDDDPFEINQFLHPYQGAMYHSIARSSGHGYWTSVAFTMAGSALWEIAGETTPPSRNDQIASGIAGGFLGEPLFRMSRLLLDRDGGSPGLWRVLAATAVAPPAGINRAMFGRRFDRPEPDLVAAADIRIQFGMTTEFDRDGPSLSTLRLDRPLIGFSVDYGFPGDIEYAHVRPFDYFRIEGTAASDRLSSLVSRGLVIGKDFSGGAARGVWGVYGGYDYLAPDIFRLSSTTVSFGTTMQSSPSARLTMQGTALAGVGYTAAQMADRTTLDSDADGATSGRAAADRDYHYGVTPQAAINLRFISGRRASLDVNAREYFISNLGGFGASRRDLIIVGDASVAVRLVGPHALAISYARFYRETRDATPVDLTQRRATIGIFYTFLGSQGFGVVR